MKILKFLGIGILALVLIFLIAAGIAPSENHLSRSIVIDAPMEAVRQNVVTFENMLKWSPWADLDTNQTVTIENDGQIGAIYTWDGADSLVGAGEQTILDITDDKVVTHLHFTRPWESEADATTTLKEVDEGVEVTWSYDDHVDYPMNIMNLFFDMDAMLGPDFEKGMARLKELVEKEVADKSNFLGYEVEVAELTPRIYLGTRDTISWEEMEAFYGKSFGNAYKKVSKAGLQMAGMPTGIYYTWDEATRTADLLAGIPVTEGSIEGLDAHAVSGKVLAIEYYGPYEGVGEAHMAIEEYCKWHDVKTEIAIEEYVTDPETEPDTNKWLTKIYYTIVE
jgi:effector-binding domain-containing protein